MGRHVKNALVTGLIDMQCPQKQLIINFSKSFFLFFSLSLSFFPPPWESWSLALKHIWLRENSAVTLSVIDVKASLWTAFHGTPKVSGLAWQLAMTFMLASHLEHWTLLSAGTNTLQGWSKSEFQMCLCGIGPNWNFYLIFFSQLPFLSYQNLWALLPGVYPPPAIYLSHLMFGPWMENIKFLFPVPCNKARASGSIYEKFYYELIGDLTHT